MLEHEAQKYRESTYPTDLAKAPVDPIDTGSIHKDVVPGMALALSGGGFRAMLYHAGALWRLYEAGILPDLKRIAAVSGGAVTAALLGLRWKRLSFDPNKTREDFVPLVVDPLREFASHTHDIPAFFIGVVLPGVSAADMMTARYRQLYGDATLQDFPDEPRFVIPAANVQSGALWRFMKPYMRDWRVGEVKNPRVPLAFAVGASSAFPPVFSPALLKLDPSTFTPGSGEDLQKPPYTSRVFLSDGGVYDNIGLETVYKRYDTILCSDGSEGIHPEPKPRRDWIRHGKRAVGLIHGQTVRLRKRQLIAAYMRKERHGAYWGIGSDIAHYGTPDVLPCPVGNTSRLAAYPTRLATIPNPTRDALINWGYAICDAALRKHVNPDLEPPEGFPYPEKGI